jgi:predicted protein tyrosine phosphatase
MEKRHKERLRQKYPEELAAKPCVLFISDDYEFLDASLSFYARNCGNIFRRQARLDLFRSCNNLNA